MKSPISYYGGKQKMVNIFLPMIPEYLLYAEPFVGGGAIFFAKPQSNRDVINDTNKEIINFYNMLQIKFVELGKIVSVTLHSRTLHKDSNVVYQNPHLFDEVKRAWAIWVLSAQSFSAMPDGSFGYDKSRNTTTKKINNKCSQFTEDNAVRLHNVQIERTDALYIIQIRDTASTFFYLRPFVL